jgi:tRNA A-37 threonylcarbamoyl transferase component Bud32
MVVVFDIIESVKIIDKEISKLDKKSEKEIDELFIQEKADSKVNFLYQFFEKEYKNKLLISKLTSFLKSHKLQLHLLSFSDDSDYIKSLGYSKIKEISKGFYLGKKDSKKFTIKIKKYYNNFEMFIVQNINEYNKLKKLNKYSLSPKVFDIFFIYNELSNQLYSLIVMEYIQGITLTKYIDHKGKLDDDNKKKLNNTINKLHNLGIYHSDLHTDNIIVVKKGKNYDFIFIEFGLAQDNKNMKNYAIKRNKLILEDFSPNPKKDDINKILYVAIANAIKKGEFNVIS